jgi:hypothetical protein
MVLFDYLDPTAEAKPACPRKDHGIADRSSAADSKPPERLISPPPVSLRPGPQTIRPLSVNIGFDLVLIQTSCLLVLGAEWKSSKMSAGFARTPKSSGGVYATLCPDHAGLGTDIVISGSDLSPIFTVQ